MLVQLLVEVRLLGISFSFRMILCLIDLILMFLLQCFFLNLFGTVLFHFNYKFQSQVINLVLSRLLDIVHDQRSYFGH